jgi:hypothetical protein
VERFEAIDSDGTRMDVGSNGSLLESLGVWATLENRGPLFRMAWT